MVTKHPDCIHALADQHNKSRHILNGNINGKQDRTTDPNPPTDSESDGHSMKVNRPTGSVGPLNFQFDDEGAKRLQAMIGHPLLEASSTKVGIRNNGVPPSTHNIPSVYKSTQWFTHNICNRAYIGAVFRLSEQVNEVVEPQATSNDTSLERAYQDLMLGRELIMAHPSAQKIAQQHGDNVAQKYLL